MGRKKIEIKKISDEKTLLVTFAKRKKGLYNKAFELGELCDCEIAVIIFTNKNCIHTYASHDLETTVNKYKSRQDRGGHTTRNDMIKFRERKKSSDCNGNDNNPSDSGPIDPTPSRADTVISPATDQCYEQGFSNSCMPSSFHGGDEFLTRTNNFTNVNDPQDLPENNEHNSISYLLDTKPPYCPRSDMISYSDSSSAITRASDEVPVFDCNQHLIYEIPWNRIHANPDKPPLETPEPPQAPVVSSSLRNRLSLVTPSLSPSHLH